VFSRIWEWHAHCNKNKAEDGLQEEDMTLKIERSTSDEYVIFTLSGRIQREHLTELSNLVGLGSAEQKVVLDLSEVKLVDREAVKLLSQCELAGARLDNCPAYIREWIWKERKTESSYEKEI
jgi:ABC-type transporter Mla MlaB component